MSESDLAIVAALVFAWGALSARLERFDVTAPIVFVLAGLALTHGPLAPLGFQPGQEPLKATAEFTLVLVLFCDASRVGVRELRADLGLYARLLGIGLPLTIGLGTLLALALPGITDAWFALLVGAALAPTDAALGAGMMANPVVPARIRRLINVESGLNDGIATPFVSVALAGVATADHVAGAADVAKAVAELGLGIAALSRSAPGPAHAGRPDLPPRRLIRHAPAAPPQRAPDLAGHLYGGSVPLRVPVPAPPWPDSIHAVASTQARLRVAPTRSSPV